MPNTVIIGYDQMFASLIAGCISAGVKPVAVMRYEKVKIHPWLLKIKDLICPSRDKSFIDSYGLYEIQARSVNSEAFKRELLRLNADILFVASWGEKIKKETFQIPKTATINCHPSLLPKYRGPNPYARVIMNGESKTGVTFHLIDENFDSGAILSQVEIKIDPSETGDTLKSKCAAAAGTEVAFLIRELNNSTIIPVNQNDSAASYYPHFTEDDVLLNFDDSYITIDRKIRGLIPWSKCFIPHNNIFLTFKKHSLEEEISEQRPGTVIDKGSDYIKVVCGNSRIIKFSGIRVYERSSFFTKLYMTITLKIGDVVI